MVGRPRCFVSTGNTSSSQTGSLEQGMTGNRFTITAYMAACTLNAKPLSSKRCMKLSMLPTSQGDGTMGLGNLLRQIRGKSTLITVESSTTFCRQQGSSAT